MFEALFGNRTVEKVLLFLFVNGTGYGTELHRILEIPLTPIQKALQRLERGGILLSDLKGKTRLYRLSPSFPLLHELEQLLKKSYALMPAAEKKQYHTATVTAGAHQPDSHHHLRTLNSFWSRLASVHWLTFYAQSKSPQGWKRQGKGKVQLEKEASNCLVFHEQGVWKGQDGKETKFSNTFRWTFDRIARMISLEHLRQGIDHPVFLFHLTPSSRHTLSSVDSHLCDGDSYFGQVQFNQCSLRLKWRVIGPEKNEQIDYFYS